MTQRRLGNGPGRAAKAGAGPDGSSVTGEEQLPHPPRAIRLPRCLRGGGAFADIVLLWVLLLATVRGFLRVQRSAGLLLLPYLAWVSFAAVLNHAIWRLNPAILGA